MQNDVNCCDISLYKILIGVRGVGHGWVGWGGSYRGRVGWVIQGYPSQGDALVLYTGAFLL